MKSEKFENVLAFNFKKLWILLLFLITEVCRTFKRSVIEIKLTFTVYRVIVYLRSMSWISCILLLFVIDGITRVSPHVYIWCQLCMYLRDFLPGHQLYSNLFIITSVRDILAKNIWLFICKHYSLILFDRHE